jgi:NAD-dependent SIR2 family protein deacetylase
LAQLTAVVRKFTKKHTMSTTPHPPAASVSAALDRAADLVATADAVLVCAGAGMGVDSGLPDFRGDTGFWRAYPPYERLGLRFTDLANPEHFATDPHFAWGFYGHRRALYRSTTPHAGFATILGWGKETRVFTSNVDGQFQRAGFAAAQVAEVHGSIHHLQCQHPCEWTIWAAPEWDVEIDESSMRAVGELPTCPHCGDVARPNILMFGDFGWVPDRTDEALRALRSWQESLSGRHVVVLELGAGTAISTVRVHAERSGTLIRINPRESAIPGARGVSLAMGAADALSEIDKRLR